MHANVYCMLFYHSVWLSQKKGTYAYVYIRNSICALLSGKSDQVILLKFFHKLKKDNVFLEKSLL